ncbi:dna alkylation repair protein : Putative DNA alkylation repair enzyme OS=Solitalea canadensis (strain ATCC 29591 / DSM 3403 / NBRC 15130 / NCIMB 12057 / USAM 9D) GN=Solca_1317 PE=4 SV=1: DNA_alkylation [Gemmata massiliana]|uniref:DNA alkylation repair protein n=1 Tax=Gemmata massiliana TaxID=1210884 RepID=A0A6P2D018_9BACT|nr:DNA alkylation repair protein [Gemmata massiliana]VTR94157.1 dna alkylation repair protein : Putative DNA alkylation repair enzyme OS=Solitalea canadensis (strain ATCC 29591 / DSM 3403 / NBRC 15130 / NCIMB 12057 / USAM 9D) GN=Solca_1317 PE=4 SV=1: DNA_alkylation [Gemmata massiliana]
MPKKPTAKIPKSAKTAPTLEQALDQLKSLGNEATRKHNTKWGAGDNQFGVKHGDIRALAKTIGSSPELATALWETGNVDAQLLAILLFNPKVPSADEVDRLVRSVSFAHVADWLHSNVVKPHPDKDALRQKWMADDNRWAARAGWQLTAGRVAKDPDGLDLAALLNRIESEMGIADPVVQWTMNAALAEIGIHFPEHRERAITVGEKLGVFRDYPCSKGCTSPFAPIWINEMVTRRGD